MVCDSATEKPSNIPQDPHDEPATHNRGIAWWKLARPTMSRRRRSFMDLSASPAPTSVGRLFQYDGTSSSEGDATSSSELWTSSKADTEAPSPSDDESPRPRSQQPRSQRLVRCNASTGSSVDERSELKARSALHFMSVGSTLSQRHGSSDSDSYSRTQAGTQREVEAKADFITYTSFADRPYPSKSGATNRRPALDAEGDTHERYVGYGIEQEVGRRNAPKAARISPSSNHFGKDCSPVNVRHGMNKSVNGRSTEADLGMTTDSSKADMSIVDDEGNDDDDCLRCDEGGLSPAPPATRRGSKGGPHAMYDILAVDRGCGFCDTSVVPFAVNEDGKEITTARIRAVTAGEGEFLARR